MIISNIYNIHNGIDTAYIYIWISKAFKIIYIGMTNNSVGPIGRAEGHFNSKGTFRKRFLEETGLGIELASDMVLLSFPLPKKREYTGVESSYRESVEYLVMKELQLQRGILNPNYDVVSWHDRYPRRTSNTEVLSLAKNIANSFVLNYSSF
ncbi:hypothetical protein EZJ43_10340 [Pedobacter changchengzhani]|uniref:Uncharacterized protein n=1 Tax=Pedobacter changchengzhani TaxID=2529274 RepID=A0A4V3A032_9SPHI|nr:GIY-YIG nuclease family protein [Pedobacter changchengzhani]TDG36073.1 hypothetical protein EZJ43_10340 [Pedobacter changchengzhani]